MSTTEKKRPLHDAMRDANDFRRLFGGCFERWVIAGSCRRLKSHVADIEHVIIPKIQCGGLLGEEKINEVWYKLESLIEVGQVKKHVYPNGSNRWGKRYRGVDFRGFNHEIFTADADNFGAILCIRTGPAKFSKYMVSELLRKGWCQSEGYVLDSEGNRVAVPDEQDFFSACGVGWIEPEQRQ